ncbi:MAG: hypothetical protein H6Q89_4416 [Myxococcaceae bacterium]|nr:hypothetical protein [Myxococcaceae bacterium]
MKRPTPLAVPVSVLVSLLCLSAGAQEPAAAPSATEPSAAESPAAVPAGEEPAVAPKPPEPAQSELERRLDLLAAELEKMRLGEVVPAAEGSVHGMGPAASKVYRTEHGVTLGGYGEALYRNFDDAGKTDVFDFVRGVLYVGYKFSDKFVLNTEIEIEHVKEIWLEFAYIDYLLMPELSFRGGLLLLPMGLINEMHEPTTFLGSVRPETETRLLPSTWRENGVGVLGEVGPVSYRVYLVNGMKGSGFTGAGVRGGRQKGAEAFSSDFAGVGRVDFTGVPGLLVGGSVYYGGSGQQLAVDLGTLIYEFHLDYKWRGLEVRGLYARANLQNVAELNAELKLTGEQSIGEEMRGWYAQVGFDVFSLWSGTEMSLTPFVRWEDLDTQLKVPEGFSSNPANDNRFLTVGANFQPIPSVVIKAEFQRKFTRDGAPQNQVNVLLGYIF